MGAAVMWHESCSKTIDEVDQSQSFGYSYQKCQRLTKQFHCRMADTYSQLDVVSLAFRLWISLKLGRIIVLGMNNVRLFERIGIRRKDDEISILNPYLVNNRKNRWKPQRGIDASESFECA
jgi:hypothetical protein